VARCWFFAASSNFLQAFELLLPSIPDVGHALVHRRSEGVLREAALIGSVRAAATSGHAEAGHAARDCCGTHAKPRSLDTSRIAWAKLMARVGEEFPLQCPACGGDIRLIPFITVPGPIRKILTHLGEPLRPPPLSSSWAAHRLGRARASALLNATSFNRRSHSCGLFGTFLGLFWTPEGFGMRFAHSASGKSPRVPPPGR
jgi:hypothetical protein